MASILAPLEIVTLIFGGCCSNVFALEVIVRNEPKSGLLITFYQWIFTTCAAYVSQFSAGHKYGLRPRQVPMKEWAIIAVMFFGINMLNNWAFAFNISVPVHIILRSFGSVTTMMAGIIRGKRYSALQVLSVAVLTVGVLVSAWADSEGKGKSMSIETSAPTSEFTTGLMMLLAAQLLSAYMGAYVEDTYAKYGASWTENLLYSHLLSLPLFLPLAGSLRQQYDRLAATAPLPINLGDAQNSSNILASILALIPDSLLQLFRSTPRGIIFLSLNALTQLACISGVNLLSAKSSAVTVTIVLNIRKLVSFIFSTLLFGHDLSPKMVLGSTLVFGSGALYGWETSWRRPRARAREQKKTANGSLAASKEKTEKKKH